MTVVELGASDRALLELVLFAIVATGYVMAFLGTALLVALGGRRG